MATIIKNDLGSVELTDQVLAMLAGYAATSCAGVMGMVSVQARDGINELLKRESLTKGVIITALPDALNIKVHVVVEYGLSMRAIAENIIDAVTYHLSHEAGVTVNNVHVVIAGIRK